MTILVRELKTVLKQKITVGSEPIMLYALRPYIYKHASPAGSLYMQIQNAAGEKIKNSETIAISSLSASNYFHGFYRFLINIGLKASTDYYIALLSSGYTFGTSAFIGWCNDWEFKNAFESDYVPAGDYDRPLGLQVWAYKNLRKVA